MMIKLRPTFTLARRYLVNREGERVPVPDDYQLPPAMRNLGFRLHQAEDYGTIVGDLIRLRDQLAEVARDDTVIRVDAILAAIEQILSQDARRQGTVVSPELDV